MQRTVGGSMLEMFKEQEKASVVGAKTEGEGKMTFGYVLFM